jgi:hypothetical protein
VPGALTVTGTNARNAAVTRSGSSVSAANAGRYGALAPSASTGFGFQGTGSSGSAPALTCAAS